MIPKTKEKIEAIRLRKLGKSLPEIAERLQVSKASASLWLRDVPLEKDIQKVLADKRRLARTKASDARRTQTKHNLADAASFADTVMNGVKIDRSLAKIICALLYWCEGEKTNNDKTFAFANSDPALMATFLDLFRKGFDVDESKLRVCLHLHDYHDQQKQLQFWSTVTHIPITQFTKPYKKDHNGAQKKEGYAGCASIRYYDTKVARQVQAVARAFLKNKGL